MIKPVEGKITTGFFEMRPLSKPLEERDHVHGAIDIGAPVGTPIYAPEKGIMFCYIAYRPMGKMYWPEMPAVHGKPFPWCNYFYDMFGGIIILQAIENNMIVRIHVMAHTYGNQIFNKLFKDEHSVYIEETKNTRFPIHGSYTPKRKVIAGELIGFVGNAGYSTGPHVHYEVHPGGRYYKHIDRLNPEELYE